MTDIRFDGRVAIVTHAGSALGRRYAQLLAVRGALVVANDADASDAIQVAKELEERGGAAIPNSDVVDTPQGAQAVIEAAINSFGAVDILVLQSDRTPDASSSQALLADKDPVELLGGLFGGYWLTQAAWIPMRERHYGRIVFSSPLGTTVAEDAAEGNAVASMGLVGVMNILKREGPDHDIVVNMVVPASTGDPDALADVVGYLAHESCTTSGEIFSVRMDGLSRLFMGVNDGIFDLGLTAAEVRDRLDEIMDPRTFLVPDEAGQEIQQLLLPKLK
jgi:NAD(P)-dependent dehydrogenase (short-subunit alcohol dehydrogenase family)